MSNIYSKKKILIIDDDSTDDTLFLAKKYGAAIIALTLDEKGIPKTKEKRVEIAKKIITEAEKAVIKKEDITLWQN